MRNERQKAREMRIAGKSYAEIGKKLNLPKSTLSSWFSSETWSQKIRENRTIQARAQAKIRAKELPRAARQYWQNIHRQYRTEAVDDFRSLSRQALFLAGIVLYWTRGDISPANSQVRFTSNDPEMIRAFRSFLVSNSLALENDIKMRLILYPDLIDSVQKSMWSRFLNVPSSSFQKTILIKRIKKTKRFSSGSCMLLIHSRKLKEKLLKWIEIYQGMLYNS